MAGINRNQSINETNTIIEQPRATRWNKTTKLNDLGTKKLKCVYLATCGNIAYYCDEAYMNEECYCFGHDICACYEGCYCCACNSICGSPIFQWVHCMRDWVGVDYNDFFAYTEYSNIEGGGGDREGEGEGEGEN